MLQYTPNNWPSDGACCAKPVNKPEDIKTAFYFIILNSVDVSKRQIGCFKARQMAYFNEMRVSSHTRK